ncbi:hypothetical protein [Parafrigoribacterium humi]|uniref:hypothetical protein n=1 Tax=Parafrigoribacterium humi TaxID=3144664 RepID=UPI0032EDD1B4
MAFLVHLYNLLRMICLPRNINEIPRTLAEELRAEGAATEVASQALKDRNILLDARAGARWRVIYVILLIGLFIGAIIWLMPQVFNFGGTVADRIDDLGNMTSILFLFLAVAANGLLNIVGSFQQSERRIARVSLVLFIALVSIALACFSSLTINTIGVGAFGFLLTVLLDLATPKSRAIKKTKMPVARSKV